MGIRRIIPDVRARDLDAAKAFYCDLLGLRVDMEEEPAFLLLGSPDEHAAQLIVNSNAHPDLPPGFAIDVDDPERVRALHAEVARRGLAVVEPLEDKPWGIRRFSVIGPDGVRVTVLSHV